MAIVVLNSLRAIGCSLLNRLFFSNFTSSIEAGAILVGDKSVRKLQTGAAQPGSIEMHAC